MEQTVNLQKVQEAMLFLRTKGERVSRRNVRAITGGGMTTVHRLMSEIEDFEALQAIAPKEGISERLHSAILAEIGDQIKQTTAKLQEQIAHLQSRETEALDALAEVESCNEKLTTQLDERISQASQEQQAAETERKVAQETIRRLEKTVGELRLERDRSNEEKEDAKIEVARTRLQIEAAEQSVMNSEAKIAGLRQEIQKQNDDKTATEKRAAISQQKATDLREALVKAEKRIRYLEQKGEPRPRK